MKDDDDIKKAIAEAVEPLGGAVLSEAETAAFLATIPTLEQQEATRLTDAEKHGRTVLDEGTPETTAILGSLWGEARKQTLETLPAFLSKLANDYQYDYGTICDALAMAAVGAAWAMDKSPQGGTTGFQSGFVMWRFIQHWTGREGPLRLVNYENMLYPQYDHEFERTIPPATFKWLQEQAQAKLDKAALAAKGDSPAPRVVQHWQSIVKGKVPFGYKLSGS